MKPIRSLLLSAGLGTRLRPLTLSTPKCLVEINNKPIIEYWIDKLEKIGTQKVLVNTHYLSKKVESFLKKQKKRKLDIQISYEKELLGTAGTLISNADFFNDSIGILIHADNFTKFELNELIEKHLSRPKKCLLTMLTFKTFNPESCGIVQVDSENILQSFHEKQVEPPGNIANAAVYVFEDDFLYWLNQNHPRVSDFSTEIIPKLLGRIYTYHTEMAYIDVGTPSSLNEARRIVNKNI